MHTNDLMAHTNAARTHHDHERERTLLMKPPSPCGCSSETVETASGTSAPLLEGTEALDRLLRDAGESLAGRQMSRRSLKMKEPAVSAAGS